jgi:hypothetical protein
VLRQSSCHWPSPDRGQSSDGNADGAARDSGAETGSPDVGAPALGKSCKVHEDCDPAAPFCVVNFGYCTEQDCTTNPDSCPPGYTCMDLSVFLPGLPYACIKL